MHDLVIRNALLLDGLGSPAVRGDLAASGGRIREVGKVDVSARETIDADGLALMPGIIDNHTHYDAPSPADDAGDRRGRRLGQRRAARRRGAPRPTLAGFFAVSKLPRMFDVERFAADCRAARAEDRTHKAVREVVARAVAKPRAVLQGLGEPAQAEIQKLYHSPELTILNVVWGPRMTIFPHNRRMWAVIGIYTGREDNIFWRRLSGARVEAAGARSMCERDAVPLGPEIIHSVTNPIPRLTGAIHVYGGDFFATGRSEWDPETLVEQRYDAQKTMRYFEESNQLYAARSPSTT